MGAHNLAFSIHLPNTKLSMSLSYADTCTRQTRTPTYTRTIALQHIWIIKIKIQANTLIFYVGENIIIYTIIYMLLYVNLCRNMLRLNVIYSFSYSKMCCTAPLLRENLYQEKSFTDSKQVYTKCENFPGTIPCRNEIQVQGNTFGNDIRNTALLSWGSLFFGNGQLFSMHR